MGYVEYDTNNSGGGWWLSDEDWKKLENAGWEVQWVKDDPFFKTTGESDRWLGALAMKARIKDVSVKVAIALWEDILGYDASEEGCSCCGQPHSFYKYDDEGNMVW